MKYCLRCGLPEYYTNIEIDENGTCNFCHFYEKHKLELANEAALKQRFEEEIALAKKKAKESGSRYDCLVGLSGGKDSTYIIYQLKHTYGMRVLAFTFQNGFQTEYSRRSIANALDKLDVDHITITMKDSELKKQY